MINNNATKFAHDSFIVAFTPGNEHLIDHYFDADIVLVNHSVSKQFNLNDIKSRLAHIHNNYQNLTSEIKDIISESDAIAFHVTQQAFCMSENRTVTMNVMNLYKLANGKVKEWQMWENFNRAK